MITLRRADEYVTENIYETSTDAVFLLSGFAGFNTAARKEACNQPSKVKRESYLSKEATISKRETFLNGTPVCNKRESYLSDCFKKSEWDNL